MKQNVMLLNLCFLIFIDSIAGWLILPILPELFLNPEHGLITANDHVNRDTIYGIALGLFPLASFFGMPIFGALSDQFGRKKIMLFGLFGMSISYVVSVEAIWIQSYQLFFISRIIGGFFIGTLTVASAAITDISTTTDLKVRNFKWMTVAQALGIVAGPIVGSVVSLFKSQEAIAYPFIIAFFLSVASLVFILFLFRETHKVENIEGGLGRLFANLRSITYVFTNKNIRYLSFGYIFYQFSFGLFSQALPLYLAQYLKYSTGTISVFLIVMGIATAISLLVILPVLKRRLSHNALTLVGLIVTNVALQTFAIFNDQYRHFIEIAAWISTIAFYMFIQFSNIGILTLFSDKVSSTEQGRIMGGAGQIQSLCFFLSALIAGHLVSHHEITVLLVSSISMLFCFLLIQFDIGKPSRQAQVSATQNVYS